MIKRKSTEATSQVKDAVAQLQNQVQELKRQYDELWKTQHQILYILSRYLRAGGAQNIRIPGRLNRQQSVVHDSRKRRRLLLEPAPLESSTSALDCKSSSSLDVGDPYVIEDDDTATWQAIGDLQGLINQIPTGREVLNETPILMQLPKNDDGVMDPSDIADYVANSAARAGSNSNGRAGSNSNPRALQLLLPAPPPSPMNETTTTTKPLSPTHLFTDSDVSLPSRGTDSTWIPPELDYSNPNLFATDNFDPQALDFTQTPFLSTGLELGDELAPLPESVPSPPTVTLLSDDDSLTRSRTSPSTSNHRSPSGPVVSSPSQLSTAPMVYSSTKLIPAPISNPSKQLTPISIPPKQLLKPPPPVTTAPFSSLPFGSSSFPCLPFTSAGSSLSPLEVPYLPQIGQTSNSNRLLSKTAKITV